MYKLKIKVTKEILERSKMCGRFNAHKNCAIALSVREIFPQADVGNCIIHPYSYSYLYGVNRFAIQMPYKATKFIADFDEATPEERTQMPEIEFEVELSDEVIAQLPIPEIEFKEIIKQSKTLELV